MNLAWALSLVLLVLLLEAFLVIAVMAKAMKRRNHHKPAPKTMLVTEPVFCQETGCECSAWPEPESDMESNGIAHPWSDLFPEDTYIRTWLRGWQIAERSGRGAFWASPDGRRYQHRRAVQIARGVEAAEARGLQKKYPCKTNRK